MCDQIAIINHGTVIANDSTANLLGQLDAKTLIITPDSPTDLPTLPDTITGQRRDNATLAFTYKTSQTRADDVLDLIKSAGITIKDVRTEDPDLEDVFLDLTRS